MPASSTTAHLSSFSQIIGRHAAAQPSAAAILGVDRRPLSYFALANLLADAGGSMRRMGIETGDRVAIVVPNGPEAATSFLSVASFATAAPLNPAYRRSEFDFYLADLRAKALIVQAGVESAARDSARELRIPVVELEASRTHAGLFTLVTSDRCTSSSEDENPRGDAALVLHTSGTTARPKIVPLTQGNLCASARNIVESLELTSADRCLNVMPLFHIHGLIGALLSTLHAGGSIICNGAFDAARCLEIIEQRHPTWYTAVPTMHQALIAAATRNGRGPKHCLRFIRSCSSALPPSVMARLEEVFETPVVEAYGMTEASHQMCCNPLPPRDRKPGSVGVATGIGVAVMDPEGNLLPPDIVGEVVIRGDNVTAGYENNPQANFTAFEHGWFHTGDQGRMDEDGYLFLTGRIKELINRGGEKISPREIDEALLTHPDVAQAMAFAVPHATLGEDIAAAVVAKEGRTLDPVELRQHAVSLLAEFKTPQRIIVVAEIPKGPTGKPQRIGLAEKLGVGAALKCVDNASDERPLGDTEQRLAAVWSELLEGRCVNRGDGFFASGGDSLTATMLIALIETQFRVAFPIQSLFESGTLAEMAAKIDLLPPIDASMVRRFDALVPFHTEGQGAPYFMVHGHSGRSIGLGTIAPYLNPEHPFYGFVARGMDGKRLPRRTIIAMAADYVAEVRTVQAQGPYFLGGFCAGGLLALEMARQLTAAGERVAHLVLLDTTHPELYEPPSRWLHAARTAKLYARRLKMRVRITTGRLPAIKLGERIVNETLRREAALYRPKPYSGDVTLIRSENHPRTADLHLGWRNAVAGRLHLHSIPGEHAGLLTRDRVGPAAQAIRECLDEAFSIEARGAARDRSQAA
jgi:oxalate---CoA ligase